MSEQGDIRRETKIGAYTVSWSAKWEQWDVYQQDEADSRFSFSATDGYGCDTEQAAIDLAKKLSRK